MKYNWEVRRVPFEELELLLKSVSTKGFEVFTILSVEGAFVVVFRKPM
jgi:hypothetical protein